MLKAKPQPETANGALAADMLALADSGQVSPRVAAWLRGLVEGDRAEELAEEKARRRAMRSRKKRVA